MVRLWRVPQSPVRWSTMGVPIPINFTTETMGVPWGMWRAATGWLTGLCCGQCGYWMWIVWKLTYSVNLSNLFSWWFDTVYHVWCLHSKYLVARCFPIVLSIDVLFSLVGWLTERVTPSWTTILGEGSQMDTYGIPNLVDQPSTRFGIPVFRQSHMGHGPRLMDDHLSFPWEWMIS